MKCPGQDPRYWTDDVVSDVPCPNCGRDVEFFKDDTSARCPRCGHRFRNPRLDLACAQWCAYAEQCLGYAPEKEAPATSAQGGLASQLIQSVKELFADRQDRLTHALLVFQHAKELLSKEGGDPRTVLAAALLLDAEPGDAPGDTAETPAMTAAKILHGLRLDEETIRGVVVVIDAVGQRKKLDTLEFALVADADLLARLTARRDRFDRLPDGIEAQLTTVTAKRRAASLFDPPPA